MKSIKEPQGSMIKKFLTVLFHQTFIMHQTLHWLTSLVNRSTLVHETGYIKNATESSRNMLTFSVAFYINIAFFSLSHKFLRFSILGMPQKSIQIQKALIFHLFNSSFMVPCDSVYILINQ